MALSHPSLIIASADGRSSGIVYTIESRKSLELNLSDLLINGRLEIFPHVEEKGLLFLNFKRKRLVLSAGAYVGLIPLTPHISIDVRPKMPVSSLARVLDTARRPLASISGVDRLYRTTDSNSDSIAEFLAENFLTALMPVWSGGLHKEYLRKSEITSYPSGRIDFTGTLPLWSRGQFHRVKSESFHQNIDIPPNRVLKGALHFLLRRMGSLKLKDRDLIRRMNDAFMEMPAVIGPIQSNDYQVTEGLLKRQLLPANRSYYFRPLEIALLILANKSVALEEHGHDVILETFILNFEELFEEYLRRILMRQTPQGMAVRNGNLEGRKPLFDDQKAPPAQPDIVLVATSTGQKLVAEVKYKEKPDRQDINQAITYALSYNTSQAVLVHQSKPGSKTGLSLIGTIRGIRISAYGFDLSVSDLTAEENAFAKCLFSVISES